MLTHPELVCSATVAQDSVRGVKRYVCFLKGMLIEGPPGPPGPAVSILLKKKQLSVLRLSTIIHHCCQNLMSLPAGGLLT